MCVRVYELFFCFEFSFKMSFSFSYLQFQCLCLKLNQSFICLFIFSPPKTLAVLINALTDFLPWSLFLLATSNHLVQQQQQQQQKANHISCSNKINCNEIKLENIKKNKQKYFQTKLNWMKPFVVKWAAQMQKKNENVRG